MIPSSNMVLMKTNRLMLASNFFFYHPVYHVLLLPFHFPFLNFLSVYYMLQLSSSPPFLTLVILPYSFPICCNPCLVILSFFYVSLSFYSVKDSNIIVSPSTLISSVYVNIDIVLDATESLACILSSLLMATIHPCYPCIVLSSLPFSEATDIFTSLSTSSLSVHVKIDISS